MNPSDWTGLLNTPRAGSSSQRTRATTGFFAAFPTVRSSSTSTSHSSFHEFRTPAPPAPRSFVIPRSSTSGNKSSTPIRTPSVATTPRSSTRSLIEAVDNKVIAAIVEGRGQARGEVGIACINIQTSNLILCQFTDTQTYTKVITKLNIFRPREILMPATCVENTGTPSQLFIQLKAEAANVEVIGVQRKMFNEGQGLQRLKQLVVDQFSPVIHLVTQKYYCLAAATALLKFVELSQSILFPPKSLKIEFQSSEDTCMIDTVTALNLELLHNNHQPASPHSLLGLLSKCRTPGGARLLRLNILQPLCKINLIQQRLDCVTELTEKREVLCSLQDVLSRVPVDIEHVISSLIQIPKVDNAKTTETRINSLIALKHTLELVPSFLTTLESTEQDCLLGYRRDFQSEVLERILNHIKLSVNEEIQVQKGAMNMKRQRLFAIKSGVHALLDIARSSYTEIIEDANEYVATLSLDMNMALRAGQNARGFYIQFTLAGRNEKFPDLPSKFLKVRRYQNVITFTSEPLLSMDMRLKELESEIEQISSRMIAELLKTIRGDISSLYKISDAIANLDLLFALTNYSLMTMRCVRPRFSNVATSITNGRHPVLDQLTNMSSPVPNNTYLSVDSNFIVITGPNMSGKTTYLKQVATLQVLAQVGSFVPADAATFRISSNIFSRLGTGDNIEDGASSFAVEMKEMSYILTNINNNSLVIIDELGRGTSVEEGTILSWAMAEHLLQTKSFIIFATHYMSLTKLESTYKNVLNFALETQEWICIDDGDDSMESRRLKYTHVLKRGVTEVENYGLKLAVTSSYPQHIVQRATTIARGITQSGRQNFNQHTLSLHDKAVYLLGSQMNLANESKETMSADELKDYFQTLQADFTSSLPVALAQNPPSVDANSENNSMESSPVSSGEMADEDDDNGGDEENGSCEVFEFEPEFELDEFEDDIDSESHEFDPNERMPAGEDEEIVSAAEHVEIESTSEQFDVGCDFESVEINEDELVEHTP